MFSTAPRLNKVDKRSNGEQSTGTNPTLPRTFNQTQVAVQALTFYGCVCFNSSPPSPWNVWYRSKLVETQPLPELPDLPLLQCIFGCVDYLMAPKTHLWSFSYHPWLLSSSKSGLNSAICTAYSFTTTLLPWNAGTVKMRMSFAVWNICLSRQSSRSSTPSR